MDQKPARGRPRNAKTHRLILRTAYNLLKRKGYHGAAIERIAAKAGVSKQTIYRWWPNKAHLFLEVLAERSDQTEDLPDTGTLREDLETLLIETFNAIREDLAPLMRALAVELLQDPSLAERMRDVFVVQYQTKIHALIQRAIARKEISPRAKTSVARDMIFGGMWYRLIFEHAPLDEKLARQLVTAALLYCRY